jgi:hypothetical protein
MFLRIEYSEGSCLMLGLMWCMCTVYGVTTLVFSGLACVHCMCRYINFSYYELCDDVRDVYIKIKSVY